MVGFVLRQSCGLCGCSCRGMDARTEGGRPCRLS